jgi:hypothetical protein
MFNISKSNDFRKMPRVGENQFIRRRTSERVRAFCRLALKYCPTTEKTVRHADNSTLRDWLRQGTLLDAIRNYSKEAQTFFGPLPVLRSDPVELAGILDAHEILATSSSELEAEVRKIEDSFRECLAEVQPDVRRRFHEIISTFPESAKLLAKEKLNLAGVAISKPNTDKDA